MVPPAARTRGGTAWPAAAMYRIYFCNEMVNRAAQYLDARGPIATNESNTPRLCAVVSKEASDALAAKALARSLTLHPMQRSCGARGEV